MVFKCCVTGCNSNYRNGPRVTVFRFPRDENLKEKWLKNIPRENYIVTDSSRLLTLSCFSWNSMSLSLFLAPPKRFYKKTGILCNDGSFEITLDNRKLKTPAGTPFKVSNEALALAVAAEWDAQKSVINQSTMHLTALCSTAIDNPYHLTKSDLVEKILSFLSTDTILFHSSEDDELYKFQQTEWQPVIDKFNKKFNVSLKPSRHLETPLVSEDDKLTIAKYLSSYNIWAVHGFCFAVETLKSIILTFSCRERFIGVEKAVLLSRLEEEFQTGHWGRVEWAHDVSQLDSQARVAASIIFIHLNSFEETRKDKKAVPSVA